MIPRRAPLFRLLGSLLLAAPGLLVPAFSEEKAQEPWSPRPYIEKALAARKAKDYAAFRENMATADRIAPGHPDFLYYLARAEALSGEPSRAVEHLLHVAAMGMIYPAGEEPDFEPVKSMPKFQEALKRFEENRAPVHRSSPAFGVPEKSFIAEGLAYDPVGDLFYVGSVHLRKIVSVSRSGAVREFASRVSGLWGAFGMKVDSRRRILWVASSALPEMEGFRPEEEGSAGVFQFDLRSGKLMNKYLLREPGRKHVFGDLAVSLQGDVYVTDSSSPAIYRILRREDRLEPFLDPGPFVSLQGIDFSADGKSLYVADYSRGLFRLGLEDRKPELLSRPEDAVLLGIDGLVRHGDALVGVQNGTRPNRIVRLVLDGRGSGVKSLEVLEANSPGMDGPTLGVVKGDDFLFIANSEWDAFEKDAAAPDVERLREPAIFKLPLAEGGKDGGLSHR
jgi:hypothetical protein